MARHRNVRAMDLDEEYEGFYSCYGRSVEDDTCISPHTEAQFLYDRSKRQQQISAFLVSQPSVEEEPEEEDDPVVLSPQNNLSARLNPMEYAKMQSCIESLQNVVGDTIPEGVLIKALQDHHCDIERALDAILSGTVESSEKKFNRQNLTFTAKGDAKQIERPKELNTPRNSKGFDSVGKAKELDFIGKPKETDSLESSKKSNTVESLPAKENKQVLNIVSEGVESNVDFSTSKEPPQNSKSQAKDILQLYDKERSNEKALINLIVIGHVDAGKSTLLGHLLFKLGYVSKKTMHKYEQDSKKLGKASFMYAWVLDETPEERKHGVTMDVAHSRFETETRIVNLLDAPGHKDFIPNMITGAVQADVAILVIDATSGEFETGFETGGQTREHTLLIRSLGVSQLAVAINKMDNVNWEKKRYDEILVKLSLFLKQAGFKENDLWFIPCSGLTGENVTTVTNSAPWYSGTTIVDVIDSFSVPERLVSKPLRISITDVFKRIGGGFCIAGQIETGCIRNGDKVLVMPTVEHSIVRGISIGDTTVQHGFAGDDVVLQLSGIDPTNVTCGNTICDISAPVKISTTFRARLVIFNISVPIIKGFQVILHYRSLSEQAIVKKLISQLNRSTGAVERKHPKCLLKNTSAVVEIEVMKPVCLELYKDYRNLGRFMLRFSGSTIAAGVITKIL